MLRTSHNIRVMIWPFNTEAFTDFSPFCTYVFTLSIRSLALQNKMTISSRAQVIQFCLTSAFVLSLTIEVKGSSKKNKSCTNYRALRRFYENFSEN